MVTFDTWLKDWQKVIHDYLWDYWGGTVWTDLIFTHTMWQEYWCCEDKLTVNNPVCVPRRRSSIRAVVRIVTWGQMFDWWWTAQNHMQHRRLSGHSHHWWLYLTAHYLILTRWGKAWCAHRSSSSRGAEYPPLTHLHTQILLIVISVTHQSLILPVTRKTRDRLQ